MKAIIRKAAAVAASAAMVLSASPLTEFASLSASAAVPNGFVYTKGTQFMLDGKPFYYGGTNCYYLYYKDNKAVENVMNDCDDMGLKVIRVWGHIDVGVKTGQTNNGVPVFQNSADGGGEKDGIYFQYFDKEKNRPVVNEGKDGLQKLDYIIAQAEKHNIKLIISFTNFWKDFGGMEQYVKWMTEAGLGNNLSTDDFYTNETMKGWYKDYVKTLLNHKNAYTGEKLMESEAVFSWELANEPRCVSDNGCTKNTLYNWAKEMSAYVKSIDPNHMVSVGDEGFFNWSRQSEKYKTTVDSDYAFSGGVGVDFDKLMTIEDIDFGTPHFYCDSWSLKIDGKGENGGDDDIDWLKCHAESAQKANKPVVLEEFGLKDRALRDDKYKSWLDLMDGTTYDGKYEYQGFNYWMIASYLGDGTPYGDYDQYTVYGPAEVEAEKGTPNARKYIMESAAKMNAKVPKNSVTPTDVKFDRNNPKDVTVTATLTTGEISGVKCNGKTLTKGTEYTISGNKITIKSSYLSKLESADYEFEVVTTAINDNPKFTISVDGNEQAAKLSITSADIDKNPKVCKDLTVNMTLNGNTLKGISCDSKALVKGSDYTVSGSTVTISKSFLMSIEKETAKLTFDFTPGKDQTINLTIKDTTGNDEFDSFDSYQNSDDVWAAYSRNQDGDEVGLDIEKKNGSNALKYTYNLKNKDYCGVTKNMGGKDLSSFKGVSLWVEGDGSGHKMTFQINCGNNEYREAYINLDFTGGKTIFLPFDSFKQAWETENPKMGVDAEHINNFSIYINEKSGGPKTGTFYVDEIYAANGAVDPTPSGDKDISKCDISVTPTRVYSGAAIKPAVTVKNGSTTLKNGTDYTVSYENNTNVGTANVTITGKGDYKGTAKKTFKITTKKISDCDVSLKKTSYAYNGTSLKPSAIVKIGNKTISNNNYTVKYENNRRSGTATVTITGKGNLRGSVKKTFTITKRALSACDVTLEKTSYNYTGKLIKPDVTVKVNGVVVYKGTYTVTYKNNKNKGTATAIITANSTDSDLKGSVSKTFTIK